MGARAVAWARARVRTRALAVSDAALVAAVVAGGALRFVGLNGVPPALNQDEAVNGYDAYSLLQTGRDHHGHPFPFAGLESFGDWASPLLTFLTVPAVGLFGLETAVLRAVTATVGVLGIVVIYFLALELFRRRAVAVAAAWTAAVLPWDVHLTRWAIPPALVPTMVALTMLCLVWTARRRDARGVVLTGLAAALTVAAYPTMKLFVPLLGLAAATVYLRDVIRIKREALVYAAIVILAVAGPVLYLSTIDPGGRTRLEQTSVFNAADVDAEFLLRQYRSYFSRAYLFSAGDGDAMHSPPRFGVALGSTGPLLVVGLLWLLAAAVRPPPGVDRRAALLLLAAIALYPIPGSLTLPSPHSLRGAHLIPLLILTTAVGLVAVADLSRRVVRRITLPATRWAVILLWSAPLALYTGRELVTRYDDYFTAYPDTVLGQFQYGLEPALAYARANEADYDLIWISDTNQPYIYVLFFAAWPPSEVHKDLVVRRNPPSFNDVSAIGPYRFGDPPNLETGDLPLLSTVEYPTGGVAYEIRGGVIPSGQRVLVVQKP